ncbi:MAG: hypothetical protein RI947_920 [Candidatus Parcubacteria bacterium]|jgi:hypothetical protein
MKISRAKLFFFSLLLIVVLGVILSFTQRNTHQSRADQELVSFTVDPSAATFPSGEEQTMTILLSSGDQSKKISGTDLYFTGDNITIIDVEDPIAVDSQSQLSKTLLIKDIQGSEAHISYVFIQPNDQLPSTLSFTVKIKGNGEGTAALGINTDRSRVTGYVTGNSYGWGTVEEGSYTVTAGTDQPGSGITLNLKLKFQGVVKKADDALNSMKVQVVIGQGDEKSEPRYGTFTSDAQGIWSGSVTFPDLQPGSDRAVFIKGPKHLQKKICEGTPVESTPGTYRCAVGNITLNQGANNFDFSTVYLLAGDLPEQSGAQNGIVDAYDTSYVRLALGSKEAKTISVADLNYDNIVDSQDYSLVIASLNVKYDEE